MCTRPPARNDRDPCRYSRGLSSAEGWQLAQGTFGEPGSLLSFSFACHPPKPALPCGSCGCPAYDVSAFLAAGDAAQLPALQRFASVQRCMAAYGSPLSGLEYAFSTSGWPGNEGDFYRTHVKWLAYPTYQVDDIEGYPVYAKADKPLFILQQNGRDGWDYVERANVDVGSVCGYSQSCGRSGYQGKSHTSSVFTWGAHPSATAFTKTTWSLQCEAAEGCAPDCAECLRWFV